MPNIPINFPGGNKQCHKAWCSCRHAQDMVDRDYLDMLIFCLGMDFVQHMKDEADASMLDESPFTGFKFTPKE